MTKKAVGRPKFEIDYDLVLELSTIMCTQEEIASVLGCNVSTLKRDEQFCTIYKNGIDKGKMSVRRNQWKLAEKNVAMAIWLGKQYLGQKEPEKDDAEVLDKLDELLKAQGK